MDAQPRSPQSPLSLLTSMCAAGIGLAPSLPDKAAAAASYPLRPAPQPPHHRCAAAHPPSRAAHPPPRRRHVLPPRPPNPPRIRWTAVFAGQARRRRRLVFPPLQSLYPTDHRPCWPRRQMLRSGGHRAPPDDLLAGGDDQGGAVVALAAARR
jgi:hypothetical protein